MDPQRSGDQTLPMPRIVVAVFATILGTWAALAPSTRADDPPCCICTDPPGWCGDPVAGDCYETCRGAGGGTATPLPLPDTPTPAPVATSTTGPPVPPPTPIPPGVECHACELGMCTYDCPSGYYYRCYSVSGIGRPSLISEECMTVEQCEPQATPTPGPTPTPGASWPGWFIQVPVIIPPARALYEPWPRGMVHLEQRFWFGGADDEVAFSEDVALQCPGIDYSRTYTSSTFRCGPDIPIVREGDHVNLQVGAAWRFWNHSDGSVFGYHPVDEVTWVIPDREWNGGTQTLYGHSAEYVFRTTSWLPDPDEDPPGYCDRHDCTTGLGWDGPTWNTECQDSRFPCDCDERVVGYDTPAYHVQMITNWFPEYTFRYDEYYCAETTKEWSGFFFARPEGDPGPGYRAATWDDACGDNSRIPAEYGGGWCPAGTSWDPNTASCSGWCGEGQIEVCSGWRWRKVTEPWRRCDLTQIGWRYPVASSSKVVVAGGEAVFSSGGNWIDMRPCGGFSQVRNHIPVPVIELQPVGPDS
jgi:hypothetical protein